MDYSYFSSQFTFAEIATDFSVMCLSFVMHFWDFSGNIAQGLTLGNGASKIYMCHHLWAVSTCPIIPHWPVWDVYFRLHGFCCNSLECAAKVATKEKTIFPHLSFFDVIVLLLKPLWKEALVQYKGCYSHPTYCRPFFSIEWLHNEFFCTKCPVIPGGGGGARPGAGGGARPPAPPPPPRRHGGGGGGGRRPRPRPSLSYLLVGRPLGLRVSFHSGSSQQSPALWLLLAPSATPRRFPISDVRRVCIVDSFIVMVRNITLTRHHSFPFCLVTPSVAS